MKTISFITLGCDKNLVDSEIALGKLLKRGINCVTSPEEAQLIVLNTCAFIQSACQEAEEWIDRIITLKRKDPGKRIAVMGCYPQRFQAQCEIRYPEVDFWIGVNDFPTIDQIIEKKEGPRSFFQSNWYLYNEETERVLSTPSHYGYIKIADGCLHRCSYCLIPIIRGPLRSRSIDSIQKEAKNLVQMGVREIILVAQDIGSYGQDQFQKRMLPKLLRQLEKTLPASIWIRLLYLSPESIDEELIDVLARSTKICHSLDIPLQHVDPDILRRMNRFSHIDLITEKLQMIRKTIPNLFLRTTFLVGFPGETEASFERLQSYITQYPFERMGAFPYSDQPDAPSFYLTPKVPDDRIRERFNSLMETQHRIMLRFHGSLVGRILPVII
ncbi:MAG: 30S ribosomal protein S12 methylthiotransferase RimO, partial [Atribacterota bacterium]